MTKKRDILLISSHVASGSVGLRASQLALEALGHTVIAVPTILLPFHLARSIAEKLVADDAAFARYLADLETQIDSTQLCAIVTGYFASPHQVEAAADLIARLKSKNPDLTYYCDPILGDEGRLYVAETIAEAIRSQLIPLTDWLMPNKFELEWLAKSPVDTPIEIKTALAALNIENAVISSTAAMMRNAIAATCFTQSKQIMGEHPVMQNVPKGTGDLLTALWVHWSSQTDKPSLALEKTLSGLLSVIRSSVAAAAEELQIAPNLGLLANPVSPVTIRQVAQR